MNIGTDGSGGYAEFCRDHGGSVPLQPHIVDGDLVLQSHGKHSFRMTA